MDYINICQLCLFCKKGNHLYKVHLNCFDDESGEVDPIKAIHYNFQCAFCHQTTVLDFKHYCPPSCILQLKYEANKRKKEMQELTEQLTSVVFKK